MAMLNNQRVINITRMDSLFATFYPEGVFEGTSKN